MDGDLSPLLLLSLSFLNSPSSRYQSRVPPTRPDRRTMKREFCEWRGRKQILEVLNFHSALSRLVIGLPRAQKLVEEEISTASAANNFSQGEGILGFKVIHLFSLNSVCYA
ncbi:hypothetical protein N431DRAFT_435600 [Stipitochalara longipes BDJ]|nr:hypothetical protein N431DRAFT_435600 [Stipitochalara longipes BDJ]